MTKDQYEIAVIKRAEHIARILAKGCDVELRGDKTKGIKVIKVEKKEV